MCGPHRTKTAALPDDWGWKRVFLGCDWFYQVGGWNYSYAARWHNATGTWAPLGTSTDSAVFALATTPSGGLIAGGYFSKADGLLTPNLARWGCKPAACIPDCDGSCDLTIDDTACFQTSFANGNPYADCDADGQLLIDDFICFQTQYAIGC